VLSKQLIDSPAVDREQLITSRPSTAAVTDNRLIVTGQCTRRVNDHWTDKPPQAVDIAIGLSCLSIIKMQIEIIPRLSLLSYRIVSYRILQCTIKPLAVPHLA